MDKTAYRWVFSQDLALGATIKSTITAESYGDIQRHDVDSDSGKIVMRVDASLMRAFDDHLFMTTRLFYDDRKWHETLDSGEKRKIAYSHIGFGIGLGYSF